MDLRLTRVFFIVQLFQFGTCETDLSSHESVFTIKYESFNLHFTNDYFSKFLRCLCDGNRQTCHAWTSPINDGINDTYVKQVYGKDIKGFRTSNLTLDCSVKEDPIRYGRNNFSINCIQSKNECSIKKITVTSRIFLEQNYCLFNCFSINWQLPDDVGIIHFNSDIILVSNCTSECMPSGRNSSDTPVNVNEKEEKGEPNLTFIILSVTISLVTFSFIIYLLRWKLKKCYWLLRKKLETFREINTIPNRDNAMKGLNSDERSDKKYIKEISVKDKLSIGRVSQKNKTLNIDNRESKDFNKIKDLHKCNALEENIDCKSSDTTANHIYTDPDVSLNEIQDNQYVTTNIAHLYEGLPPVSTHEDHHLVEQRNSLLNSDKAIYEKSTSGFYCDLEVSEVSERHNREAPSTSAGRHYEPTHPGGFSLCTDRNVLIPEQNIYSTLGKHEKRLYNEYNFIPILK